MMIHGDIHVHLAAGGAMVTAKCTATKQSTKLKIKIAAFCMKDWYNRPVVAAVPKVPPHKLKKYCIKGSVTLATE
jgi:hypothetical protein